MDKQNNRLISIFVATLLFLFANFSGWLFQEIANLIYKIHADNYISALPQPNIDNIVFENSIIDLFLSPLDYLAAVKNVFNIDFICSGTGVFKPLQIVCEIASLLNVLISVHFRNNLNIVLGLLIGLSFAQGYIFFIGYLLELFAYFFNSLPVPTIP